MKKINDYLKKEGSIVSLSLMIGVIIGSISGDLGLWIALSVCWGVTMEQSNKKDDCNKDK